MATKQQIVTAEQIWEAALAEVPLDDSGPSFSEPEPVPNAVFLGMFWALVAEALMVGICLWLMG